MLPVFCWQRHAIATFNVLSSEDRGVVAALLSELPVLRHEACFYTANAPPPLPKKRVGKLGGDGEPEPPLLR